MDDPNAQSRPIILLIRGGETFDCMIDTHVLTESGDGLRDLSLGTCVQAWETGDAVEQLFVFHPSIRGLQRPNHPAAGMAIVTAGADRLARE